MDATQSNQKLYPYSTKYGYGISNGSEWVVLPKYRWLQSFYGGYAYGESFDGTKFLLDKTGSEHELFELVKSVCSPASIEFINPSSAIDRPGCVIVTTSEEIIVVSLDDMLQVNVVEAFCLDSQISPYYGAEWLLIRVNEGGNYRMTISHPLVGRATIKGIEYADPPYRDCEALAVKRHLDKAWSYYDFSHRELRSERYFLAHSFSSGLGLVQRASSSEFEFINRHFESVNGLKFEWADVFRHGLAAGSKQGVSGYFNAHGLCRFTASGYLGRFNRCGHAIVEDDDGCIGIFDTEGVCQLAGLNACTFFDGEYPFYQCEQHGEEIVLASDLTLVTANS